MSKPDENRQISDVPEINFENISPQWLIQMANAEDECGCISVGGLACDLWLMQEATQ